MGKDVYDKLARHLDNLPAGFPPTDSGVELRILKRLFTPDEAELATKLTLIPEQAGVIARRAGLDRAEAEERLQAMARKGLIFAIEPPGRPALYMAAQYAIGIWEYHVNDLDEELINDMNEYLPTFISPDTWRKAPQLRTIPVEKSLDVEHEILSYERAEELIRQQKHLLVAPCICRREHKMVGQGCDRPEESCLVFSWGATYYEKNGIGRRIDQEEALEILRRADEAGLVLQPSNAQKVTNICCCCGCCCQVLLNLKRHPKPATLVSSPFIAAFEPSECIGCGVCVERCQMDALSLVEDEDGQERAKLDRDRCIGCGLCVSTCPSGSLKLVRKPESEQPKVPRNQLETLIQMGRARGKLGPASLAVMNLKSKLDRLLAAK